MTTLPTVYSTSTPIIASHRYHFDYASKRESYVDCCYAVLGLNRVAKSLPDNYRHAAYRLKTRWIEKLYREGHCVQAYEEYGLYHFKMKIDGIVFAWHIPEKVVSWRIEEKRGPVQFDYVDNLPRSERSIEEAVSLLEWVLS